MKHNTYKCISVLVALSMGFPVAYILEEMSKLQRSYLNILREGTTSFVDHNETVHSTSSSACPSKSNNGTRPDFIASSNRSCLSLSAQESFFDHTQEQYNNFTWDELVKIKQSSNLIETDNPVWMCVAAKTGCTSWIHFSLYVNHGIMFKPHTFARNPGVVHSVKPEVKWSNMVFMMKAHKSPDEIVHLFSSFPHVVIARNPYVRFVSSWKDWLSRRAVDKRNITLEQFLDIYKSGKVGPLPDHVYPVSRTCAVNKPMNYTVLRLEEQALWFDAFVEKYGMAEFMTNFTASGNLVYQSGLTDASKLTNHVKEAAGRDPWPGHLTASSHHRGSGSSRHAVTQHYTPDIAAQVTQLFMEDFVNFQYPVSSANAFGM